jgi:hypothetical protein
MVGWPQGIVERLRPRNAAPGAMRYAASRRHRQASQEHAMETAVIVRGRITSARHIELDEAVPGIDGEVEVTVRRVATPEGAGSVSVDIFELISAASPGARSKEDIDQQIADERGSWTDR